MLLAISIIVDTLADVSKCNNVGHLLGNWTSGQAYRSFLAYS